MDAERVVDTTVAQRERISEWLLSRAIAVAFAESAAAVAAEDEGPRNLSQMDIDADQYIDYLSEESAALIGQIAALLQIEPASDPAETISEIKEVIFTYLLGDNDYNNNNDPNNAEKNGSTARKTKTTKTTAESPSLNFSLVDLAAAGPRSGSERVDEALSLLRMLYHHEMLQRQDFVNNAITVVQAVTANPEVSIKSAKQGRG